MRKDDRTILTQLLLCSVLLGVGCGDDTKVQPRLDSGVVDGKVADVNQADTTVPKDSAKPDTQADSALAIDTNQADAPTAPDANRADLARDTDKDDAPAPQDVPQADVLGRDAGLGDATVDAFDGMADALAETMATITFRFKNPGTQVVYLHSDCVMPIQVVSVSDGTEYANGYFCACDCADSGCTDTRMCGACLAPAGVPIDPGKSQEIVWAARRSTLQTKTGTGWTFQCVSHAAIPTGTYRVAIQVYSNTTDSAAKTNGRTVSQAFPLTTANATVEVTL